MKEPHDPVDSALNLLRSEQWAADQSFGSELENRLMQEFNDGNKPASRIGRSRTFVLALAFVAIGGVTFAATGGVETIRSWFVTVEINGEEFGLELNEAGEGEFKVETEDGATASGVIQVTDTPDGGRTMEVAVTTSDEDEDNGTVSVREVMNKMKFGGMLAEASLEDLGDAEPTKTWTDAKGIGQALYILPMEEGKGSRLFLVNDTEAAEPKVILLTATPYALIGENIQSDIQVDKDGLITIKRDNGAGHVQSIKLRTQQSSGDEHGMRKLKMETPDGGIKVRVEAGAEEE